MQVPFSITHRGVEKSDFVDELVRKRAAKLEDFCDHIISCKVALERPNAHPRMGSHWRVRIDMTVAGGREIVVDRGQLDGSVRDDLYDAINDAFDVAQRRLKRLNAKQHGEVKAHPQQEPAGVIEKLFEDYGFIRTADGREIYFHGNSILNDDFEDLEVGMTVAFAEEAGEMGPKATTVRLMDRRHGRRAKGEEERPSRPML